MISIIIPTLNEEKVIKSTILALKSALRLEHEIIVSDGGSTDGTISIAKQYADKVVTPSNNARQTISIGRNLGARQAKGEFLVFLDADCQLENPDLFFKRALERFEDDKRLVAMTTGLAVFPKDQTLSDQMVFGFFNNYFRVINNYFHVGDSPGEFQMMRKEAYEAVGGFRSDLVCHEDSTMFYSLSRIGRTLFEPTLTVYHTGRRAHNIGWPKLLFFWFMNTVFVLVFKRSFSKVWEPIR